MKFFFGFWVINGRIGFFVFLGRRICFGLGYFIVLWLVGDVVKRFVILRINFYV